MILDDEFEEWRIWFDSHKNKDGKINLDENPELVNYLQHFYNTKVVLIADFEPIKNFGDTVNFKRINHD